MRNIFLLITALFIILQSCKVEEPEFNTKNYFAEYSSSEFQIFQLDTLESQIIKGQRGTRIYYNRNDFDVKPGEPVNLRLKEIYNLNELFYLNINTITDKNELLESSGVIYVEFTSNGKRINLRESENLLIDFPDGKLKQNDIFFAKLDSLGQFTWTKDEKSFRGFLFEESIKPVPSDSIEFYLNTGQISLDNETDFQFLPAELVNDINWINLDKIISPDSRISFQLKPNLKKLNSVSIFFIYDGLNSFISEYRKKDNLSFTDIPIVNKTSILVMAKIDGKYFAEIIELNDQERIDLNMKQIDLDDLRAIIDK